MRFIEGPLRRTSSVRPLPEPEGSFALEVPPSKCVPPLPFLTTSAVYSARGHAGLLHPATGLGVRLVGPRLAEASRGFPKRLPFEAFPSLAALRRSPLPKKRSPDIDPLSPLLLQRHAVLPRHSSTFTRPQGFHPPRSPLRD
jgi:hypothetical protein